MGHVVTKEGIAVDPKKIRAMMEWETPRNVDEVRSFVGIVGYYRRLISNSSHIACPIMSPQRKVRNLNGQRNVQPVLNK